MTQNESLQQPDAWMFPADALLHRQSGTNLNHTALEHKNGKLLINLAIPMISKPKNASPGAILQYYREKNGISRSELADILGITEYGVVNLEKGFNPIHYKNALLIGKVLDIDPEELLDEYTRFCMPGYGKKIKAIRAAYGVSQKDFALIVGVDRSTVSIWEAEINEHHPGREAYNIIKKMAKEKGVDVS